MCEALAPTPEQKYKVVGCHGSYWLAVFVAFAVCFFVRASVLVRLSRHLFVSTVSLISTFVHYLFILCCCLWTSAKSWLRDVVGLFYRVA